jgi:hypothetical protein
MVQFVQHGLILAKIWVWWLLSAHLNCANIYSRVQFGTKGCHLDIDKLQSYSAFSLTNSNVIFSLVYVQSLTFPYSAYFMDIAFHLMFVYFSFIRWCSKEVSPASLWQLMQPVLLWKWGLCSKIRTGHVFCFVMKIRVSSPSLCILCG